MENDQNCYSFEVFTAVTMNNVVFRMFRRVALVRTDVSEKRSASTMRATRISEVGTTLVVTSNRRKLQRNIVFLRSVCRLLQ
jgi:hypothetical protein